jgi:glycerol kinase
MKYLLSIDQSTTATKAILFDQSGKLVARENREHKQFYPQPEWVEHDPIEIYSNTVTAIRQVLEKSKLDQADVIALSITNQRETVVIWDKQTGLPVYNAVVWQCRRGTEICSNLREKGYDDLIKSRTGLLIDPYFSASGAQWVVENVAGVSELILQNRLAIGTIDSWLIYKLTEGIVHATDYTNASRTLLFNIIDKKWDTEILTLFHIPENALPEAMPCDSVFGYTTVEGLFNVEIPITGVMGDSHAALFGQFCFKKGMAKATYGTGSSIMLNIGNQFKLSPQGVVTSIGYSLNNETVYVFEGNIHCTGATIKWLVDDLELIATSKESEQVATSVGDNNGVYFVPAFTGLGAPYWDNNANALICGMNRSAKKAHIVRAALESIAYQVKDLLDAMTIKSGITLTELRVDGGPTKNHFLMQFQSDMLNASINRAEIEEASALGAALMAGLKLQLWKSTDELDVIRQNSSSITPSMDENERIHLYQGWKMAVERTLLKK